VDAKGKGKGDLQNKEEEEEDQQKKEEREAIAPFAWTRQGRKEQEAVCRERNKTKLTRTGEHEQSKKEVLISTTEMLSVYTQRGKGEKRATEKV